MRNLSNELMWSHCKKKTINDKTNEIPSLNIFFILTMVIFEGLLHSLFFSLMMKNVCSVNEKIWGTKNIKKVSTTEFLWSYFGLLTRKKKLEKLLANWLRAKSVFIVRPHDISQTFPMAVEIYFGTKPKKDGENGKEIEQD